MGITAKKCVQTAYICSTPDDNEHIGKGAGEFFDGALDDVSSLSASEECYQESSDANFSNITFSLPGNDFMIYFPGNPNLLNKITQVTIANGIKEIGDRHTHSACSIL